MFLSSIHLFSCFTVLVHNFQYVWGILIMVKRRFNVDSGWYDTMIRNQVVGPNRLVFGSIVKNFVKLRFIACVTY